MNEAERQRFLGQHKTAIEAFCEKWRVAEFAFYGAFLDDQAGAGQKLDVLLKFQPGIEPDLFQNIEMEDELTALFKRPVDIVSRVPSQNTSRYIAREAVVNVPVKPLLAPGDQTALARIIKAAQDAHGFTRSGSRAGFENDLKAQYAALWCLENIGRAAQEISETLQTQQPDIPWKDMARLADAFITTYYRIDLDAVWTIITQYLPDIINQLSAVLPE